MWTVEHESQASPGLWYLADEDRTIHGQRRLFPPLDSPAAGFPGEYFLSEGVAQLMCDVLNARDYPGGD